MSIKVDNDEDLWEMAFQQPTPEPIQPEENPFKSKIIEVDPTRQLPSRLSINYCRDRFNELAQTAMPPLQSIRVNNKRRKEENTSHNPRILDKEIKLEPVDDCFYGAPTNSVVKNFSSTMESQIALNREQGAAVLKRSLATVDYSQRRKASDKMNHAPFQSNPHRPTESKFENVSVKSTSTAYQLMCSAGSCENNNNYNFYDHESHGGPVAKKAKQSRHTETYYVNPSMHYQVTPVTKNPYFGLANRLREVKVEVIEPRDDEHERLSGKRPADHGSVMANTTSDKRSAPPIHGGSSSHFQKEPKSEPIEHDFNFN